MTEDAKIYFSLVLIILASLLLDVIIVIVARLTFPKRYFKTKAPAAIKSYYYDRQSDDFQEQL